MELFARINRFIEDRLNIKSYPIKVVLLFSVITFVSMFLSFVIDVVYSTYEVKREIQTAAERAAKFRTLAIRNVIFAILETDSALVKSVEEKGYSSLKPFIEGYLGCAYGEGFFFGSVDRELVKEAVRSSGGKRTYFHLFRDIWLGVAVIEHKDKVYAFCHKVPYLESILSKRLGAIAKYGAEFYFGERPRDISEEDVVVSHENNYSNANMYVVVPFKNVLRAVVSDRVFLYMRLYFTFLVFLGLSYILWAKLISYPITKLRENIEKLEKGDYDVNVPELISAEDEFGVIGRLLKRFAEDTKGRLERLELILETSTKTIGSPEEAVPIVRYTLNGLDRIFGSLFSVFVVEEVDTGRVIFLVGSDKAGDEDVERALSVYREKKGQAIALEEPACVRQQTDRGCMSMTFFKLDDRTYGAVIIAFDKEVDKLNESYIRVISQHMIGMVRLSYIASMDPLTGIPNRRMLEHDIDYYGKIAKRYGKTFSLIMIDLDNFKHVNDTYGHAVGDQVLRKLAKLVKEKVRDTDTVYRYGGEEFAVLCPETTKEGAYQLAERIREAVRDTKFWIERDKYLYMTISLGVATFPEDTENVEDLLAVADISLYRAKSEGKNKTVALEPSFSKEMYVQRFHKERELFELLDKGNYTHEFQPIMELKSEEVFGYELLFRLIKNETPVPMGNFMNEVNDPVLIEAIDISTVESLINYAKREELTNKCMFVNISPRSIEREQIFDKLKSVPRHLRSRVCVEITEREQFMNVSKAKEYFDYMKSLGYKVVMDDFGSGFSSISYMRHFIKFLDIIKVDGSYVKNVSRDPYNRAILSSIKTMADKFSIDVVAEHIETERDLSVIKKMNIKFGQGYVFKNYILKSSPK